MIDFVYYTDFKLKDQKSVSDWLLSLANKEGFKIKRIIENCPDGPELLETSTIE